MVFSGYVNHDRIALDDPQRVQSVSGALAQVASPIIAAAAKVVPKLQSVAPESFNESLANARDGLRDLGASALSLLRGSDKRETAAPLPTEKTALDPPALERPITETDDPHKGRFGGNASVGGFTLAAKFGDTEGAKLVRISLSVSAGRDFESYDDVVEFFLHPTFRPDRLRAAFHGHDAELRIVAWGGFTVGAWLPARRIELELDLANLPDAPKVIREL